MPHTSHPRWSASMLRRDLNARALQLARTHSLLHDLSTGSSPAIVFGSDDHGRHGNFDPAAYAAICACPDWQRRLAKPHTASRRSPARKDWRWMELDSASSSDALLMNIFCHPAVFNGASLAPPIASLLNIDPAAKPGFGSHPGVPLRTTRRTRPVKVVRVAPSDHALKPVIPPKPEPPNRPYLVDRTEIDLTLQDSTATLFIEAKLTESAFQTAPPRLIERYRDLEAVFEVDRLPRKLPPTPALRAPHPSQSYRHGWEVDPAPSADRDPDPDPEASFLNPPLRPAPVRIDGYQLIRNVLAAYAANASFCVLCDARRHDLIETWYSVLSAVHSPTFATRLKLLTWQELARALPPSLQQFLATKYGILG